MKIRTSELIGPALDWAVAKCEGDTECVQFSPLASSKHYFAPSKRWSQGGPIIERERIAVDPDAGDNQWAASTRDAPYYCVGPTPLIAAMRCYCCAKLGEFVDIPEELCQRESN